MNAMTVLHYAAMEGEVNFTFTVRVLMVASFFFCLTIVNNEVSK
jgi:hypothetical protein